MKLPLKIKRLVWVKKMSNVKEKVYKREDVDFEIRKLFKNFGFQAEVQPISGKKPLVVAVMRGGEYFARSVAMKYKLDLDFIRVKHYDDTKTMETIEVSVPASLFNEKRHILFVDDVYDTGLTKQVVQRLFPDSSYIVLLRKGIEFNGVYADTIAKEDWARFFWETEKVDIENEIKRYE